MHLANNNLIYEIDLQIVKCKLSVFYINIVIYSQSINSSHEIIEAYCKKKVDPTLATSAEMILKK